MSKEAKSRIKINKLLEASGWRFFDDETGKANIQLEANAKLSRRHIDELGEDFEKSKNGFVDFLLLDGKGFPLVVLEAKKEEKEPLDGKEQARRYAQSLNVRFVILSNGNLHYFWDIDTGNPTIITTFPTLDSLRHFSAFKPDRKRLVEERVEEDFIVQTQYPTYKNDPRWKNDAERPTLIDDRGLKFLRHYQQKAVFGLQQSAKQNCDRYLFEMATGTGKTLVSAAVIKLFLKTGNAKRALFLVDRLELEDQAWKSFVRYLKNDYTCVIYKENKDDWRKAEIVVSTVQSLTFDNKYLKLFSPTDFELVISDEAHRSISGNNRALFEYFIGFKLGLTATPKDYLKNIDADELKENDVRAWERRQLLDTYKTFGCESGNPTFRYSLIDGVRDGVLVNPVVCDARTEISTELLAEKGYAVLMQNDDGEDEEKTFFHTDFEKKFFSDKTNLIFCKTFIENALKDPIDGEIGKSIVFCVSQKHASKITQILNEIAMKLWPDKYNSDFAIQVTSNVTDAQQFTVNFSNNNLCVVENYRPHIDYQTDWPILTLDELCHKITDGTHKTPDYKQEGIPFLRVTDLTNSNESKKFISRKEHEELIARCKPEKGDVLLSKNGTIGVAKAIDWDYEFSIFVSLALLKPDKKRIYPKYLELYLNSDGGQAQAKAHSKSGTVTNLHLIEIKQFKIPLPPLSKQKELAEA
ncbi:MAG: DEAD/DEAH box helicase family protein, partial [Mollicutes bacterium]|nr:DEAD/DEAH box helicase family protein [Mollicutes bacterium]